MQPIYSNFSGLEISFQGAVPEEVLSSLRKAKNKAKDNPHNCIIYLKGFNRPIIISNKGRPGGYTFCLDTGIDGEIWSIVDTEKPDNWNIHVSVKSLGLALYEYRKIKRKIRWFLTNILKVEGQERINQLSFIIDLKSDNFILNPKNLRTHNRCKKEMGLDNYFCAGRMPYKQVSLYNISKKIKLYGQSYWLKFWNIKTELLNEEIWRLEIRAGKKALNEYGIYKFNDFEVHAADVLAQILNDIKYDAPFWQEAISISQFCFINTDFNIKRSKAIKAVKSVFMLNNEFIEQLAMFEAGLPKDIQTPRVMKAIHEHICERLMLKPKKIILI